MDDMWSTKAWDDVRNIFPDDSNGSRIMITTRLVDVAAYPDPRSPLYEMRLMDANRSWNLLRQKVFSQQECPPDKESIGKEIARGCGGLPLAIVTIAGVLCKTDVSWEKISRDVNKSVASNAHFEKILSLSYTHLPHHLRPCFLYMGGFPEDHEIRVSTLVKLWIAEGFLKYGDTSKSLEEQAEEYLEDLIKKSLIFATKMKTNGKIKSCGIHDLVRDLCIKIGHEEKFLLNAEKVIPNGKIKCCSVHDLVRSLEDLVYLHCLENLKIRIHADFPYREKLNPVFPRTLKKLSLSGWRVPWERLTIVGSLPNLEVLKLKDYACRGSTWETEEGEFLELRFLFIDKSDLQHWIAESSHFPRLRSLLLHRCWCLTEIPEGIGEIPTLELIEVDNGNTSLAESAKGIQEKQQSWGNDGLQLRWVHS